MSILIKGMKMPKTGKEYKVVIITDDGVFVMSETDGKIIIYDAIEIPDGHGRLIDENVLEEMAQKERGNYDAIWRKSLYSMGEILHAIKCTPTVIPSDKDSEI